MENSTILSSFIPLEAWYEILRRLPTKSLSRFRCVSKTWNSLIRSPNFIAAHRAATAAAAAGNTHLFVQIGPSNQSLVPDKHLLIDLKPLESGLNFLQPSQSSIPSSVAILAHANGVILGTVRSGSEARHVLFNPAIHRYVILPEPVSTTCCYQLGLGFVPSKNDVGVVKIIYDPCVELFLQYTFPPIVKVCYARERVWKDIAPNLASTCLISRRPHGHCCINGRVHWVVRARYQYSRYLPCESENLLVFDFERERFETLDLPGELVKDLKPLLSGITLLLFKQNLSVLLRNLHPISLQRKYSLWSLMAYPDVSSWAKLWSFDAKWEVLSSVFVGWRADYKLIVSRDQEDIMRVNDPDVGGSKESYVFPFKGESAEYVCGFDESLFLSDEEMHALPLTQMQPILPN